MKLEITTDLMTAAKSAVAAKYDTLASARDQFVDRLAENIAAQSQPDFRWTNSAVRPNLDRPEVEPLTEAEMRMVVGTWTARHPEDMATDHEWAKMNLAFDVAAAQRAKVRPRVELSEAEMNAVLDRWHHNYDRQPGETSTHQLMRQIEEARAKKARG